MGISSYFKTSVTPAAISGPINDAEKHTRNIVNNANEFQDRLPGSLAPLSNTGPNSPGLNTPQSMSRPGSRNGNRQAQDDRLVDEIKHQVVLNHLFQHQCSSLWIRDVSLNSEGAMVRKRKGEYLYRPAGLEQSSFAQAMIALNVQVCSGAPSSRTHLILPMKSLTNLRLLSLRQQSLSHPV